MKGTVVFVAFFALVICMIPMFAISKDDKQDDSAAVHRPTQISSYAAEKTTDSDKPDPNSTASEAETVAEQEQINPQRISENGVSHFLILNETTGEVETVPVQDFVRGAVAAEMPATFHMEALKAQAVAAHTYALRNHLEQQKNPDPYLNGADFSADPLNMQVYATVEQVYEFYGDSADEYWNKICEAADSVLSCILEYEEEPIVAAYHAMSAGQTENAGNVWSGYAPYLQASGSEGDLLAPNYETSVVFSEEELKNKILSAYPAADLSEDPESWIGAIHRSDSGYVTEITIGGIVMHGKDVRVLLDLRSHNFDVYHANKNFHFTVYGYGHGVGLSQYGADYLARQGDTFEEILQNYYTGAELRQIQPDLLA